MSENNETQQEGLVFAITSRIMKALKIDDKGKIQKFFAKEKKSAEKNIKRFDKNIAKQNDDYQEALEEINENIEDAEQRFAEAVDAVDVESISNNNDMAEFSVKYWDNIADMQEALDDLKDAKADLAVTLKDEVTKLEDQKARYQNRLNIIK